MSYVKTYENFIFGSNLNEASEDSVNITKERIEHLKATGTKLKEKDYKSLIEKKKAAINTAKEQKDSLKTQMAERELQITLLRSKKHDLRISMMQQEIMFLNQKLTYQTESVKIKDEIDKLKA